MPLSVGDVAPNFSALDQSGTEHTLTDYRGQWVVLYFYPKDDTPGCTTEACGIRDNYEELRQQTVVLGVSGDSVASHKRFADKYSLPFILLADPERQIIDAYGANGLIFAKRTTFIIDPAGQIAKIYDKVSPADHPVELLTDLAQRRAA